MIPLESEATYHIYNHANGSENIFSNDGNYLFFLKQYKTYISPFTDTFSYCLMPNHFHFLLRIKNEKETITSFEEKGKNISDIFLKPPALEKMRSKQFSNFFSSYTQAFNKQQGRMGSLFMKNFKRKKVTDSKYLMKLVHYIHYNPVEAGFCSRPEHWKFSSYPAILSGKTSLVLRDEVIEWFGDFENFIYCHSNPPDSF